MAAMPELESPTVTAIYKMYEAEHVDEPARSYLGMSAIGDPCARRLWYGWRWVGAPKWSGRMYRVFGTGLREEPRVHDELRAIGVEVHEHDGDGQQWAVEACSGHLLGHLDGAVLGLPEAPKTWHVLEVKTHSTKSFGTLKSKGVAEGFPRHFAQMQMYMGCTGMHRACYFAVNKDTDEIYVERIEFDHKAFDALVAKAQSIIDAAEPPLKLSDDPEYFECRWCAHKEQCHGVAAPPQNCRTCAHSTPFVAGQWLCEHYGAPIPEESQRAGCDQHRPIPALVASFLDLERAEPGNVVVWRNRLNGAEVRQPDYSSREIHAAADKAFLGDDFLKMIKATFPGATVAPQRVEDIRVIRDDAPIKDDLEAIYGPKAAA